MGPRWNQAACCAALMMAGAACGFAAEAADPDARFEWREVSGERLELLYDGRPALSYECAALDESSPARREATFKPYHHVWSPDGRTRLTNGAAAALYPHHHGVFYGFNKVTYHGDKECDVWHCTDGAFQSHEDTEFRKSIYEVSPDVRQNFGRHAARIAWHGRGGETFAQETREMKVSRPAFHGAEGWLLDFRSHLETVDGQPIHLDGDPQHAGFHFRAAPEKIGNLEPEENAAKQIYFLRPDGKGAIGETRNWDRDHPDAPTNAQHVNHPWDAMSFILQGVRYTVLYLDSPDNPKPSRSSERAYGRFGTYFVTDVTADNPLDVRYGLWVQAGEMTVDQCQAIAARFLIEK